MKNRIIKLGTILLAFITLNLNISIQAKPTKENIGIKIIKSIMNDFEELYNLKENFIHNPKMTYKEYLSKKDIISNKISSKIDFNKVVIMSMQTKCFTYIKCKESYWNIKGITLKQKRNFINTFKKLIQEITYPIAADYFKDYKKTYKVIKDKIKDKNKDKSKDKLYDKLYREIHVKSIVHYKRKTIDTDWYIYLKKKQNKWLIYDIAVEGERWIGSFRSQFNAIIRKAKTKKQGFIKLLNLMHKKLKETIEDNKHTLLKKKKKFAKKTN